MAIRNSFRLLGRLGSEALTPSVAEAAQHTAKPYLQTALRGVSLTTPAHVVCTCACLMSNPRPVLTVHIWAPADRCHCMLSCQPGDC